MNREDLNNKYGEKLIDEIFKKGYLDGCTVRINSDGTEDIPETDITLAIRDMNSKKINYFEWD